MTDRTEDRRSPWIVAAVALWGLVFLFGALGVLERLATGREHAGYGSYVVWGLFVAAYIYFIGLSAGAFLLSSLAYVFRVKKLEPIGKLALFTAVITLFLALVSIWFDLGHMERFYYVFTRPNFHSMMAWMVWLYTAYFLLLLVECWWALRGDLARIAAGSGLRARLARLALLGRGEPADPERPARVLRVLGAVGIPLAIAFHGGVGALFATVVARPYWHTPLYPILFLTGALVSGGALLLCVSSLTLPRNAWSQDVLKTISRFVLGLLVFDLILEWAEYSIPLWYQVGPEGELLREVLFGPFWFVFWIFHILLGSAIPVYLLLRRSSSRVALGVAGGLIALTFMAVRLNIVVPGLIEPQLRGLERAFQHPRLVFEYMPTVFEWQVVLFLGALGVALLYLGMRLLPLVPGETPSEEALQS